ncbi:hypothetical protein AAY473_037223 [Plecturocebus cupreus]
MTSWSPPSPREPPRAPWLNNHHRKPPFSKLGSPRLCWPWPISSWGCRKAARSKPSCLTAGLLDQDLQQLWWRFRHLPQQALPHNLVASTIKSSTRSAGDLETLAQQALPCNYVVAAYIAIKI